MLIEDEEIDAKIRNLTADKRFAQVKKTADFFQHNNPVEFRDGIRTTFSLFKIEQHLFLSYHKERGLLGFVANSKEEVLQRLDAVKPRVAPPQKVLAKSLALRVKKINDDIKEYNKACAMYRAQTPAHANTWVDLPLIDIGSSIQEFQQNVIERIQTDDYRWKRIRQEIRNIIEVDQINDEGWGRAHALLLTNAILTE